MEVAERLAPVTNGGVVFEPRQCPCVNLAGASLLAKQKSKKGQVPSMEQVQPVAMGIRDEIERGSREMLDVLGPPPQEIPRQEFECRHSSHTVSVADVPAPSADNPYVGGPEG